MNLKQTFVAITDKLIPLCVWMGAVMLSVVGSLISIHRHLQFGSGYYDFGIFDTALWKISRLQSPIIDHYVLSGKLHFADHFTPSLYVFAPLYWLTSSQLTMFIAQAVVVGVSTVFVYYSAKKVLSSSLAAFGVYIGYAGFLGLHNALLFDIHEITFMTAFLAASYWAIAHGKRRIFIATFFLVLGFKESLFFLGMGLALTAGLYRKEWRKLCGILFMLSIAYGLVLIKFVMPALAGMDYFYAPPRHDSIFGYVEALFAPQVKRETIFVSLLNFVFLPLLGFETFFTLASHYATRFLSAGAERWGIGLHYNAEIAPTLAFAAALGYRRLLGYVRSQPARRMAPWILLVLTLGSVLYLSVIQTRTPLYLAMIPDYYKASQQFAFLEKMVSQVPPEASVMAQNNILAHFTHQEAWLTRLNYEKFEPDYVLFDQREGQSVAQLLEERPGDIAKAFMKIQSDPQYELIWNEGEQYIFKRVDGLGDGAKDSG